MNPAQIENLARRCWDEVYSHDMAVSAMGLLGEREMNALKNCYVLAFLDALKHAKDLATTDEIKAISDYWRPNHAGDDPKTYRGDPVGKPDAERTPNQRDARRVP